MKSQNLLNKYLVTTVFLFLYNILNKYNIVVILVSFFTLYIYVNVDVVHITFSILSPPTLLFRKIKNNQLDLITKKNTEY